MLSYVAAERCLILLGIFAKCANSLFVLMVSMCCLHMMQPLMPGRVECVWRLTIDINAHVRLQIIEYMSPPRSRVWGSHDAIAIGAFKWRTIFRSLRRCGNSNTAAADQGGRIRSLSEA